MKLYILIGAMGVLLAGCFFDSDKDSEPKLIGYSTGETGGGEIIGAKYKDYSFWRLSRDSAGVDTFYVYGKNADIGKLGKRTRAALQSWPVKVAIYDMGGQCLSFTQAAGDSVEACFPYQVQVN